MQNADKDLLYLLRVLEAIGKILRYSEEYQTADEFLFSNNQKDYNASLLLLMQIGEQAAKVSTNTKANFPEIKWQAIKDFRNRIVHDYVNIDSLIVFSIIRHGLPPLVLQISNCIKEQISKNVFKINELEISKGSIFYQNINFSLLQ
ncbi:MAG: HepT-like ribonuclease domain-containing protein [Ginsengibacter sp.]